MRKFRFTTDHEWLCLEENGVVTVGITDFAQKALGDVVFIQLPEVGSYEVGSEVAVLESVKAASNIVMPLTGEIFEVNQELVDEPDLVNSAPMGEGWFFKVKVADPSVLNTLMDSAAYEQYAVDSE